MVSFLIVIDRPGSIHEIIWSDPAYVVSRHHDTIFLLFHEAERSGILATINELGADKDDFKALSVASRDLGCLIGLFLLSDEDKILVFGTDNINAASEECRQSQEFIIYMFMKTVRSFSNALVFHNNTAARQQFENIQTLNNELINTKRLLEKTNAQMNVMNMDLNNRLVKDALTGLVSRYQYGSEIRLLIHANPGKLGIFTYLDIDNFKAVNDNYGHATGDKYLITFADRLKKLPIKNTIRMRIGGDEFGLFTYGLENVSSQLMEEIWGYLQTGILSKPIELDDITLPIAISAGMAVYGADTEEIYELIDYADYAMYVAKKSGKNKYHAFSKKEYENRKVKIYEN